MSPEPLTIPVPGTGEDEMAASDEFKALHEGNMAALGEINVMHMADLKTISKAQDYAWLRDAGLVSLKQALGAREVGSETNPGGPAKPE